MAKNKLARFAENESFDNLFQYSYNEIMNGVPNKGKWCSDFFKNNNPIVLELGCGKGEYTVGLAKNDPNKNFIHDKTMHNKWDAEEILVNKSSCVIQEQAQDTF